VQALDNVSFSVGHGSIHAIAGQNGAGKSTLIKILSGAEVPDAGTIMVGGRPVRPRSPQEAQDAGIQTIYQELSLVPQLSVAENILLGELPHRAGRLVDWSRMRRTAEEALGRIGFWLDVRQPVERLSVAEQQAVEIAKVLHRKARIILLDEPTSALPPPDVGALFTVLRSLAASGVTLLYISHRIEELYNLCDAVTVLRNGRRTASFTTADSRPADVVSAMVGSELTGSLEQVALSGQRPPRLGTGQPGEVLLTVRDVAEEGKVSGVSFDLHAGEVLGLAGLVGSGQSELAALLAGARHPTGGTVTFGGKRLRLRSPSEAIKAGIGYLPQDRKSQGIVPDLSVAGNITLASLPMFSRLSVRNGRREVRTAQSLAARLDMRIAGVMQPMKTLSGGNQQKAIIARWLVRSVRLLICDEPTRGIDVGAKEEIYRLIREFAAGGGTVLIASSELSEAMMCDRVLIMARGRISGELRHDDIDPQGKAIISRFA
jgi:ribose transport system ATP-binding protein